MQILHVNRDRSLVTRMVLKTNSRTDMLHSFGGSNQVVVLNTIIKDSSCISFCTCTGMQDQAEV